MSEPKIFLVSCLHALPQHRYEDKPVSTHEEPLGKFSASCTPFGTATEAESRREAIYALFSSCGCHGITIREMPTKPKWSAQDMLTARTVTRRIHAGEDTPRFWEVAIAEALAQARAEGYTQGIKDERDEPDDDQPLSAADAIGFNT